MTQETPDEAAQIRKCMDEVGWLREQNTILSEALRAVFGTAAGALTRTAGPSPDLGELVMEIMARGMDGEGDGAGDGPEGNPCSMGALTEVPFATGVSDGAWHAIARESLAYLRVSEADSVAFAACGELVRVAVKFGAYDRDSVPVIYNPCRLCAWKVAAAGGKEAMKAEAARLEPSSTEATALDEATGGCAVLAAGVCRAFIEAGADENHGLDHPATAQLLAMATAHAPVLLVDETCNEGECEHDSEPCPSRAACPTCSLQDGDWAGEWQGQYRKECTVAAPCQVLLTLAKHAGVE